MSGPPSWILIYAMRRTDKKLPSFPPDFDGAAVRHMLYTLALTAFPHVYANYFERPQLHTLHNRSSELWSPLHDRRVRDRRDA